MARIEGDVAPGFSGVADQFAKHFEAGEELGAGVCALRNGRVLFELWGGARDRAGAAPWTRDTLTPIYSATKPIAAFTLARAADRAGVSLETPVAALWPAFGAHGKERVTIAELMSHQAGVPGFPAPIDPALWLDPPACAEAIAQLAPMWPPGTASGYHPSTWGYLVGEIARRIDGRSLGTILREDICAPRGIDFWIGLPDNEHARCADMKRPTRLPDLGPLNPMKRAAFLEKWSGPDRGGALWRRIEIPSANGHGTARAVAALYGLYASGGDGLLSPAMFTALTQVRIEGPDLVLPFDLSWRAGVLGNSTGVFGPSANALGHYGWGGACGFADPDLGLAFAYIPNRQSHHLIGDPRARALIEALYAALG